MNNLSSNITEYLNKLKKPVEIIEYKNERDELVCKTVDMLREGRKGTEYEFKLVSKKTIAILFNKKFSNNNYSLYIFLTKCKNNKSKTGFGGAFWSNIK